MLPSLQAKVMQVLEKRTMRRLGETEERPVDVRLIASTHRDLEQMMKAGTFREDLWYRLSLARVELPPLRERKGDTQLLAQHFLYELAERTGRVRPHGFSPAALKALERFSWPGNVRQLRATVDSAFLLARGELIQIGDLSPELQGSKNTLDPASEQALGTWSEASQVGRLQIGQRYLSAVLQRYEGNVVDAAQHAGVERESFYRLLRKHEVDPTQYRKESD
jgi:two-component system response regulator HydG